MKPEELGTHYESILDKEARKEGGVYYSPPLIVDYMVESSLGTVLKGKAPEEIAKMKIVDPACGAGVFLVAAYQHLLDWHVKHIGKLTLTQRRKILTNNIFGVDIDPLAVEITKYCLSMKCSEGKKPSPKLDKNIRCGNSLIDSEFCWNKKFPHVFKQGGFDIVIGNPPYVFARNSKFKGMTKEVKAYFYKNFVLSEYQINLYPLFIEKGTEILKDDGILCFITPNNWLTLNTNKKLRQFVLKQTDVAITNFYKKVFASADVDAAIVLFRKNNKSATGKIKLAEWRKKYALIGKIEKNKILSGKDGVINVEALRGNDTFSLLEKIERCSVSLSEIAKVKVGLKAYQIGKGQPKQTEKIKRERIFHSKKESDGSIKYLDGRDVCRYSLGWSGEYLKYGKHLAEPRKNFDIFSTPRILVRQIPSPLPYCINACFTEETMLNDLNSMNIIYIKVSPFYLLGILNSRVISYWFAHKFGKLQRGIFPQFKINELAQFPIPNVAPGKQRAIITLVKKILSAKEANPQANTSGLERKIDKLVYELYGLTEEEIAVVEGQS